MPQKVTFLTRYLTYTGSVDLVSEKYRFSMDWNIRNGDWRATVTRESDGAILAADRRVSPGAPLLKVTEGEFWVYGVDPYTQTAFKTGSLAVLFWTADELIEGEASLGRDPTPSIV